MYIYVYIYVYIHTKVRRYQHQVTHSFLLSSLFFFVAVHDITIINIVIIIIIVDYYGIMASESIGGMKSLDRKKGTKNKQGSNASPIYAIL